ncbi:MAG: hypothetical protein KY449_06270 [Proteobacteria bacterium]|nr:hypothetical protein [Pseudomonadota bacterium]
MSPQSHRRLTLLNGEYLLRPLTRRMGNRALLTCIQVLMRLVWPRTEVLFRIPVLGKLFRFVVPGPTTWTIRELSCKQRYRRAVMDTFDMLAPAFDQPQREGDVRGLLEKKRG